MGKSIPSHAVPAMLKWAREQEGFSVAIVAEKEKITVEQLEKWERGDGSPSLAKLLNLATRYKRPLHVFYLPKPELGFEIRRVKDFRTLPRDADREFSHELRRAIRIAQERQAWMSAFLEGEGADPTGIVGLVKKSDSPEAIARKIRTLLGVKPCQQFEFQTISSAYVFWRGQVEKAGVFVFQASRVQIEEMRGFALPDKFAPAVVLNSKDEYGPKTFSLFHEFIHVLLGETSLSGGGKSLFSFVPSNQIEKLCNAATAELLVPANDFAARVPRDWRNNDKAAIASLSRKYLVSQSVIVLRLLELGMIDNGYADNWFDNVKVYKKKNESSKIPQSTLALARVGESFARITLSAYSQGRIHGGELSSLLAMKARHIPRLEEAVFPYMVSPKNDKQAS